MVGGTWAIDDVGMEAMEQPRVWRTIGLGIPATVVVLGVIGVWANWFVLVAVAAVLASLVGVHSTSPHRAERAVALTGLLVIGLPGLAVGLLLDPVSVAGLVRNGFSDRTAR